MASYARAPVAGGGWPGWKERGTRRRGAGAEWGGQPESGAERGPTLPRAACPVGVDSCRPLLEPGLKLALKPGVGRWDPPEAQTGARALRELCVGLAAGTDELPTTFRFESSRFWFPVALGAIYLFSSSLAHARGGCWGTECGVRGASICLYQVVRPGQVWGVVGSGARCGPGLSTQLAEFAKSRRKGRGHRIQGSPGCWSLHTPVSPAHPTPCRCPQSWLTDSLRGAGVENSASTRGSFTFRSSSLEILPEWGAHASLHVEGISEESSGD